MTELEAREIEGKGVFWFSFYYGRTEIGILHESQDNWYIVKKWREWVQSEFKDQFLQDPENAEVVLLPMIKKLDEGVKDDLPEYDSTVTTSDYDEVILIVLGAGASYDFCGGKVRLPLTNQLFSDDFADLRSLYPGAAQLYSDLAEVKNLEDYFQRKWKLITKSHNPDLLKSIISIQFYLQHLLLRLSVFHHHNTPNYYSALIQQMRDYICLCNNRVRFVVVNFNYDTLFEQELTKVMNYNFNSITDYDNPKHAISVIKVHGSANWCRYYKRVHRHNEQERRFSELSHLHNICDFLPDVVLNLEPEISVMKKTIKDFEQFQFSLDDSLNTPISKSRGNRFPEF